MKKNPKIRTPEPAPRTDLLTRLNDIIKRCEGVRERCEGLGGCHINVDEEFQQCNEISTIAAALKRYLFPDAT